MTDKEIYLAARAYLANMVGECHTAALAGYLLADGHTLSEMCGTLMRAAPYELSDCARQGDAIERKRYGKTFLIHPWLWHASDGTTPRSRVTAPKFNWPAWRASIETRLTRLEPK